MSYKLVLLLALATAQRLQSLDAIKISNIMFNDKGVEIRIGELLKTSRPGSAQPYFNFPYFNKKELYVASHIKFYLSVTKSLRGSIDSLLISTRKPYQKVSKDTLSRWIRSTLQLCGVDSIKLIVLDMRLRQRHLKKD